MRGDEYPCNIDVWVDNPPAEISNVSILKWPSFPNYLYSELMCLIDSWEICFIYSSYWNNFDNFHNFNFCNTVEINFISWKKKVPSNPSKVPSLYLENHYDSSRRSDVFGLLGPNT